MSLLARKKVILGAVESTYGTDASPSGSANAILVRNPDLTPLNAETTGRNTERPTLGREITFHYGEHIALSFEVELAGSGTAGDAPAWGPLLKACGFAETVNAGTDVQYDPVSTGFESLTIYWVMDGNQHAMTGARGSVQFSVSPNDGMPYMTFSFTGLYVPPSSVSQPSADYSAFQTPDPVTNDNTPTFTLHGTSHNMISFSLDMANQVNYRNVVGDETVQIIDREPQGSLTIEAPDVGTTDLFSTALSHTLGELSLTHGTTAGNIVEFSTPASTSDGGVQVLDPSYGEDDGIATLETSLPLIPSSTGDDELKVTVK
jgi:hypothetical protein